MNGHSKLILPANFYECNLNRLSLELMGTILGAKYLAFFSLSFPQNERKIYQFYSVCIFFEDSVLNDKVEK